MTDIVSTDLEASPPSGAWLRIMARVYDPFVWLGETVGMRNRRKALVENARGRVVEIGAGTGLNIAHYPDGIAELVLTEPDEAMRRISGFSWPPTGNITRASSRWPTGAGPARVA